MIKQVTSSNPIMHKGFWSPTPTHNTCWMSPLLVWSCMWDLLTVRKIHRKSPDLSVNDACDDMWQLHSPAFSSTIWSFWQRSMKPSIRLANSTTYWMASVIFTAQSCHITSRGCAEQMGKTLKQK